MNLGVGAVDHRAGKPRWGRGWGGDGAELWICSGLPYYVHLHVAIITP